MPEAPSLRKLERTLFALIRAPDGVAPALRGAGISRRRLAEVIAGDDRLGPLGRVGIYAHMYFLRLQDVLREAFPKLRTVLGDDRFGALCTDYLDAHPSRHPSLRHLGNRLAGFLAGPRRARPRCPALPPWAADLAALEWARYDVFDAADADPLALTNLQELAPGDFPSLPLRLAPAHRLLPVSHAVEETWQSLHKQQPLAEAPPRPGPLLVWRQEAMVYHRRVEALEGALLDQVAAGASFGTLCERIATEVAEPAPAAFQLLGRWVSDGLLIRERQA